MLYKVVEKKNHKYIIDNTSHNLKKKKLHKFHTHGPCKKFSTFFHSYKCLSNF